MGKLEYKKETYRYFKYFYNDLDNKMLLDYGSNCGTFLDSSYGLFKEELYTGIDVDKEAIEEGKKLFPKANFIHYDAFNIAYNPKGNLIQKPKFEHNFDVIISYSVVTHTTLDDFKSTIDWLVSLLNKEGKLLITYLNVDHGRSKKFFTEKRKELFGRCDDIFTEDYVYLIDDKITTDPSESDHFLLWFKNEYLRSILKIYNIDLFDAPNHNKSCFQSCIVITK